MRSTLSLCRDLHTQLLRRGLADLPQNPFAWAAALRSFLAAGHPRAAVYLYALSRQLGSEPFKFTFLYALKAYSAMGSLQNGKSLHSNLIKLRLDFDAYLRSALVSFYSNLGRIDDAVRVFEESGDGNNSVICNAAIAGCFKNGDVDRARELFDGMPDRDLASWNTVINGYAKRGDVDVARALFDEMPERDSVSWSAMVVGYVQSRRAAEALKLFDEMFRCGVRPEAFTLATMLSGCAQIGALDMGKWIHAYIDKHKLLRDVVLGTSLVDMYAKCGSIDLALQVFHGMEHKNLSSWNAAIHGLALNGRGNDAIALFGKMEETGVRPNDITFVGVLSACSHIGAVVEGRRQFKHMCEDLKIVPKIEHYGCMVDLFARAGLVGEAREVIADMPMDPNQIILGSFLRACLIHGGDANATSREVSKLRDGDGGCHVMLSNIYASNKQWGGVARIREMMKGIGLQKVPGGSSIEVNSVVHEFVAEDRSHASWDEVYMMINRLSAHLEMEDYKGLSMGEKN